MMTFRSDRPAAVQFQRKLGELEDQAASSGWVWDAALSRWVDTLCVLIEGRRG